MKVLGIYPEGIKYTTVEGGWNRPLNIEAQYCYKGFDHYKINDRFYWYYDQERVYHIEDSKTRKIVFVAIGSCPNEIVEEFLKIKENYPQWKD